MGVIAPQEKGQGYSLKLKVKRRHEKAKDTPKSITQRHKDTKTQRKA
jgi:hypothetical protein